MTPDRERRAWSPSPAPKKQTRGTGPGQASDASDGGRPLESGVRSDMEKRLGEDLSGVRIHAEPDAGESAQELNAKAYAVGEDVVFAPGQFAPGTSEGAMLLEHELGHVVEHRHGAPPGIYRAPQGQKLPDAPERPALVPPLGMDPELGSLSLGLSTLDGFDFNGSALKPRHIAELADVAGKLTMLLQKMPGGRVAVTGHTDLVGGEETNLRLGLRRAQAVRDALVEAGVPAASIATVTEGEHLPVVKTAKAEPRNRRVEVRFQGTLVTPGGVGGSGGLVRGPADRRWPVEPPAKPWLPGVPPFPPYEPPRQQGPAPPVPQPAPTKPEPKGHEGPARAGTPGDAFHAITKIPDVHAWIERNKKEQLDKLDKGTSTGEKAVITTTVVSIGGLTTAGISTDPAARKAVLEALDGLEIPVPGAPWLKLKARTPGGSVGGVLQLDLIKIVGGAR